MKHFVRILAATAAVSLVTVTGCKPAAQSQSETQSLNNFAKSSSGTFVPNDCYGGADAEKNVVLGVEQEWDHVDFSQVASSEKATLQSAIKRAMSAVPQNLQVLYFGLGGTIKFTADPGSACNLSGAKEQFAREGKSSTQACWSISSNNDFVIYMQPNTDAIKHSTVRMFGYVLSQILTNINLNDQNKIVYEKDESFADTLALINKGFMDDVRNSIAAAKKSGKEPKYNMDANKNLVSDPDFKYFVFSESFDSFYCTAALRQDMAKADEFPKTHAEFVKMDAALSQVKIEESAGSSLTEEAPITIDDSAAALAPTAGMNLWGGRLFGGIARVGAGIGRGVFRGGAAIGRGIFRGGAAVVRGGGRLLGGAVRGTGRILGGTARVVGRGAVGIGRWLFGG